MMPHRKILLTATAITLLVVTIGFSGTIKALLTRSVSVPSVGTVKAIGVGVYWDNSCSNVTSSIDWGVIEPGATTNVTLYIRNEGNAAVTLSLTTENWNPSEASNFMTLEWDYDRRTLNPNEVIQVTLTLSVSSSIEGITSFSFDIIITGSG
ncbi:MAG: hypothetical protein ACTSUS_04140 [Candidatus Freyarchaeota archaeon]